MTVATKKSYNIRGFAPLIANFTELLKSPLQFLKRNSEEFDGISTFRVLNYNIVHVFKPEYLQHIINNRDNYGQGKDRDHMKLLFGNGLLTVDGALWKKQRKLLQPVFKTENILPFARKIVVCNQNISKDLEEIAQKDNPKNNYIDINEITLKLVNNVMGQILMSSEINKEVLTVGDILLNLKVDTLNRMKKPALPLWVPTPENVDYNRKKYLVEKIVNDTITERRDTGTKYNDLLSDLMNLQYEDRKEKMTDEQLKDEIISIYAAGHEPTAIALSFALYLIYTHPEIEKKFTKELDEVLGGKDPTFKNIRNLKYTMQIIQEALRLYPPVWISSKTALGDDMVGDLKIKKGDSIVFSTYIIQRHKKVWKDAEVFNPERFSPEKIKDIKPMSYFPFGSGDKFCIGNNFALIILQISLAMIGQKYRFNLKPNHTLEINPFTTLRPKNGIMMSVEQVN